VRRLLVLLLMLPLAACGTSHGGERSDSQTLTVLAASSLTETYTELAHQFEQQHPGVQVKLAFDSSATLAQQAVDGAPADVLATADQQTMDDAGPAVSGDPQLFAGNLLTLVTPADNAAGISAVSDLDNPDVRYVACVATAPCGKLARQVLDADHITADPASLEIDVKSVLAKVTSGEADAGLVYETDAVAAGDAVHRIVLPHAGDFPTTYYVAALKQSAQPSLAKEFVDLVLSDAGQQTLRTAGFTAAYVSE
jgi:molybdate transport system substrate-binding protein